MMFRLLRKLRLEILLRDQFRCQECGSSRNLQVHHRRYEVKFNPDDFVTLCSHCHARTKKSRRLPLSDYPFTSIVIESKGHIPPEPAIEVELVDLGDDEFDRELMESIEKGELRVDAAGEARRRVGS